MASKRVRMSLETRQKVVDMSEKEGLSEKEIHDKLVADGINVRIVAIKQMLNKYREFGYITDRPRTKYGREILDTIDEVIRKFHGEWVPDEDLRDIVRDLTDVDIPTEMIGRLRRRLGHKMVTQLVVDPEYYELKRLEKELKKKMEERNKALKSTNPAITPSKDKRKSTECNLQSAKGNSLPPTKSVSLSSTKSVSLSPTKSVSLSPTKSVSLSSTKSESLSSSKGTTLKKTGTPTHENQTGKENTTSLAVLNLQSAADILANRNMKQSSISSYFRKKTGDDRKKDIVQSRVLRPKQPKLKSIK